ncbi:MAG: trypsin-like peptidase domain-containing protein [Nitriliruptorales bacterium]
MVDEPGAWGRLRDGLLGGPRRLGWWTLPVFLAVGLAGAVLAGSLAVVFYAQQVRSLERETAGARQEIRGAVERVSAVASEAIAAVGSEVAAVRDELGAVPPIADPLAVGLVAVRATVPVEGSAPAPAPSPTGGETATPPPPPPARTEVRVGSGFAVVSGDGTFFATSFAVVADPQRPDAAIREAEVILAGQSLVAQVHSWDPALDLALLHVDGVTDVNVAEWRPAEEESRVGDRLFAVGISSGGSLVQFRGAVAAIDASSVVTDIALLDAMRGGPLVDPQGRVVGVLSSEYSPDGGDGAVNPSVPVRFLCVRLVRC